MSDDGEDYMSDAFLAQLEQAAAKTGGGRGGLHGARSLSSHRKQAAIAKKANNLKPLKERYMIVGASKVPQARRF